MLKQGGAPRRRKRAVSGALPALTFDLAAFLESSSPTRKVVSYEPSAVIFSQGNPADHVYYLQEGSVKLSVISHAGKEAVVALLGPGDFLGEGCLAGQPLRMGTARAIDASTALVIDKNEMATMLHQQPKLADRFLLHMLARNIRIEEDLVDQLFNSSENRLARTLLLLARYGTREKPLPLPKLSQETLAERVGTTRSRINLFMNKFRDLGFIDYNGSITVHDSLLTVVLHD